jgi:hypothetical protein
VVNTLFMALDHHNMDYGMSETLQNGNYVRIFFSIFFNYCIKIVTDEDSIGN